MNRDWPYVCPGRCMEVSGTHDPVHPWPGAKPRQSQRLKKARGPLLLLLEGPESNA